MSFLSKYQTLSGQKINYGKSSFLVSHKMVASRIVMISKATGFPRGSFPFTYLGCPIFKGMSKQAYFDDIVTKVQNKLAGWISRVLSPGGRLILIKHVLTSIPIHVLSVFDVPKVVLHRLDRIMSNFLWGGAELIKKRHWLSWDIVTSPFEEGGLGVRKLEDVMRALRMKMAWKFNTDNSLWTQFLKAKYGVMASSVDSIRGSAVWKKLQQAWLASKDHIAWSVGKGEVSFWYDNWIGNGAIAARCGVQITQHELKVKEVVGNLI